MELDIWHGGLGWPECLPASPRGGRYERAEVSGGYRCWGPGMTWACEYSPRSLTNEGSASLGGGLEASLQSLNPLANGLYSIFS